MDVILIGPKSIKLKGKKSSLVVNPTSNISKTDTEGVLVLGDYEEKSFSKLEGQRIIISGPGEYEVNGAKISAIKDNGGLACVVDLDGVKVLVGSGKGIEKIYDKIDNCNVVVVWAEDDFDHGVLPKIEPNVILIYGSKSQEVGKSLGKDSIDKVIKFSTTHDKLPEDLQVFLLG